LYCSAGAAAVAISESKGEKEAPLGIVSSKYV